MRKTIKKIQSFKNQGKKITALTAYDYSTAKYIDEGGVDMILVGDSAAQVVLGLNDTTEISIEEMIIFTKAVSRATNNALLVADMPFGSFQVNKEETMKNALLFIKNGANAIKLEGCSDLTIENIKHLTQNSIPVLGHLGFTPMSINCLSGHKIQGKDFDKTLEILSQAKKLEQAGCFAIVLELMAEQSASYITKNLTVPTIGIGAGAGCDGQILVSDDLFGKYDRFKPKFSRQYINLKEQMLEAVKNYCNDVEQGLFPNKNESFELDYNEAKKLENYR